MQEVRFAYSTLPDLLAELQLTVTELHQRLLRRGFKFDRKTLYRLATREPLQTINAPVVGALCAEFKIGLDDLLTWEKPRPKLHRIAAETQARLDELMAKNNEGTLTAREKKDLAGLGETVERLSLENARMLATQTGVTDRRARTARQTAVMRKRPQK